MNIIIVSNMKHVCICLMIIPSGPQQVASLPAPLRPRRARSSPYCANSNNSRFIKRGVQWKQGVVAYIIL